MSPPAGGLGARCAFLLVCFYAAAATAATLQVSTSGSDSNNCLSPAAACRTIQAAINKAANGDTINIAPGAYAEILFLSQRENLTIAGSTGVVITHPGPTASPLRSNAFVNRSKNIELRDLRITGTAQLDGVQVFDSIGIRITRCILEGTGGAGGALFTGFSDVNIADSTIQDNATGIRVDGNSTVQLGSPQGISTVQRNGVGVVVRSGAFFLRGPAVVQDNGVGVQGQEGATIKLCCQQDGKRRIVNNGIRILARGASLDLRGPADDGRLRHHYRGAQLRVAGHRDPQQWLSRYGGDPALRRHAAACRDIRERHRHQRQRRQRRRPHP